jgi:multiple sugar transport system permease protein
MVILLAIMVIPVFSSIRLSFFEWSLRDIRNVPVFIKLRNFQDILQNENFQTSIKVTLIFTISVVVLEMFSGMVIALMLEEGVPGLRLFRTIFILPVMIAPVVVGVVWKFLYNPSYGKINYFLEQLNLKPVGWLSDPDMALVSIILTDIWQWTPFVFLLLLAGLQGIPHDLSDAARVDGANYFQNLIHIKLPCISGVIGITAVLRLIDAFRGLVVMLIMTNGGPGVSTEILSLHLYKTAFTDQRLGKASAVAVILLIIITLLSIVFVKNSLKEKKE